jgi:hypothetical protein
MADAVPLPSRSTSNSHPAWRWLRAGIVVGLVAGVCYGAVRLLSHKVRDLTPDEVRQRMDADTLPLDSAIEQLNRMDVRDRREVMQSPDAQKYFQKLKPADRMRFVNETLDRGIRANIERYRKMNKDEKQAFIEEIQQAQSDQRERMQNMSPEEKAQMKQALEASNFEQIVENAVKAYLSASTSEERAELAPLFNGALDNMKTMRGMK